METRSHKRLKVKEDENDCEEFSEREKYVMSNVFGEVLPNILKYLPIWTLRACRLANKSWHHASQQILLNRPGHFLSFRYNYRTKTYTLYCFERNKRGRGIRNFNTLLKKRMTTSSFSSKSPLCGYYKFHGGPLNTDDIQTFFNLIGSSIRGLTLDLANYGSNNLPTDVTSPETFSHLLSTQVPHLTYLKLQYLPGYWNNLQIPDNFLSSNIPFLTYLDISRLEVQDLIILKKLLTASVNAQVTLTYRLHIPSPELRSLLTGVTLCNQKFETTDVSIRALRDPNDLEFIQKCSESNFKCDNMYLFLGDDGYPRDPNPDLTMSHVAQAEQAYLKIFSNCSDSVSMVMCDPIGFGALNNLDKIEGSTQSFPKVKKFCLPTQRVGPPLVDENDWFKLSNLFPNLEEVELTMNDTYPLAVYMPPFTSDQVNTVTTLKLSSSRKIPSLSENLHLLFPMVETLNLEGFNHFQEIAPQFWKFSKLTQIKLFVEIDNNDKQPQLDVAFTGFGKDTVKRILDGSLKVGEEERNKYKENLSIADLKELGHLSILFNDGSNWELQSSYSLVTDVSLQHAFKLMPQVDIDFWAQYNGFINKKNIKVFEKSLEFLTSSLPNVSFDDF